MQECEMTTLKLHSKALSVRVSPRSNYNHTITGASSEALNVNLNQYTKQNNQIAVKPKGLRSPFKKEFNQGSPQIKSFDNNNKINAGF